MWIYLTAKQEIGEVSKEVKVSANVKTIDEFDELMSKFNLAVKGEMIDEE